MATLARPSDFQAHNPLDLLEDVVGIYEWPFERVSDDELVVSCQGRWCDYAMHVTWRADLAAIQLACVLDSPIPEARICAVHELLAIVNGRMWLGHFDLAGSRSTPVFRQAVLLRGAHGASVEQLEDLVEIAVSECERFYPAFQYVSWGGKAPAEAVEASLIETVGEA